MGTTLHAPQPWPHITAALRGHGPRRVAIAYLDHTGPELLPLRAGDQLIVNAARSAVRAHATSPTALARFLDAGVQVLSTPDLHTGLIVTPVKVIVGPASASHASTVADETALVTDDPTAIAAAHAFLDSLTDTIEVDEVFLDSATAIWQLGRVVPLAGIGSRTRTAHDFLPTPVRRMFLLHTRDYTPTAEDETRWAAPAPGRGGPDPRYHIEWIRRNTPGADRRSRLEPGDVMANIKAGRVTTDPALCSDSYAAALTTESLCANQPSLLPSNPSTLIRPAPITPISFPPDRPRDSSRSCCGCRRHCHRS